MCPLCLLQYKQLKTSVQEQHKLTYAVYAPHNAIRFPTSNHITYVKMVEIGAKLRELQMSSYDISNMSYFRIFCQLKIYARKRHEKHMLFLTFTIVIARDGT